MAAALSYISALLSIGYGYDYSDEVFVYGSYLLDFKRGIEILIPNREISVKDCSNEEFFCVKTSNDVIGFANLVVPRKCIKVKVGDIWRHDTIITEVVSKENGLDFGVSDNVYRLRGNIVSAAIAYYSPKYGIIELQYKLDNLSNSPRLRKITIPSLYRCSPV